MRRKICEFYLAGFCPDGKECKNGVHLKVSGKGEEGDKERDRRERVEELERREEENRRDFGRREWRGGRAGGRGGKWKNRRERG